MSRIYKINKVIRYVSGGLAIIFILLFLASLLITAIT